MSLFHTHRWEIVEVGYYVASYPWSRDVTDITLVLYRCAKCGGSKTAELRGHWSRAALEGAK